MQYKGREKINMPHVDRNGYLLFNSSDETPSTDEKPRLVRLTLTHSYNDRIKGIISSISHGCFKDCTNLVQANILGNVSTIKAEAFENCISLKTIVLPASLKTIEGSGEYEEWRDDEQGSGIRKVMRAAAFSNCPGLQTVYYMGTKEQWAKINFGPGNGCLLNASIEYDCEIATFFSNMEHIYHDFGTRDEFFAEVFDFERVTRFYPFSLLSDRDWPAGIRAYRLVIFICERHSVYENGVCIYTNPHFSGGPDSLFRGSTDAYSVPGSKGACSLECAIENAKRMSIELGRRTAVVRLAGEHNIC